MKAAPPGAVFVCHLAQRYLSILCNLYRKAILLFISHCAFPRLVDRVRIGRLRLLHRTASAVSAFASAH